MLVAGAAGHGNVAEGEDPALSAGLTSDTRIVFRRQLSYPLYYCLRSRPVDPDIVS